MFFLFVSRISELLVFLTSIVTIWAEASDELVAVFPPPDHS